MAVRLAVRTEKNLTPSFRRGPNIMKEYWGNEQATKEVLTDDGWLRTGDMGFMDREGYLYVQDRCESDP
jgi:long-subunit acyl-CoA synthetase (AMP-forming)